MMKAIALSLVLILASTAEAAATTAGEWAFMHHVVSPNVPGADEVACGDIDGDGNPDIVCSQSEGTQLPVRWFRNLGGDLPKWKSSERIGPVHSDWEGEQGWMGSCLGDFDGDGDLDVVSGAKGSFSGVSHPVCWFENAKGDGTVWAEHPLPVSGDYIDNCRAADFNGDGRDDIIAQKYHGGGVYLLVCPRPSDAKQPEQWQCRRIAGGRSGLCLADLDADGRLDIIVDNQWFKNPGDPAQENWPAFGISGAPAGVKNAAADMDGDGRIDVVLSSEEGRGIWWFEAPPEPLKGKWTRHAISEDYVGNHSLCVADFDRNGRPDILVAEMHTKGKHRVTVFENADGRGGKWAEHVIAETGSHNALTADVNGDSMPDIIGCNFKESDNPLEVWFNTLPPPRKSGGADQALGRPTGLKSMRKPPFMYATPASPRSSCP